MSYCYNDNMSKRQISSTSWANDNNCYCSEYMACQIGHLSYRHQWGSFSKNDESLQPWINQDNDYVIIVVCLYQQNYWYTKHQLDHWVPGYTRSSTQLIVKIYFPLPSSIFFPKKKVFNCVIGEKSIES